MHESAMRAEEIRRYQRTGNFVEGEMVPHD